VSLLIAFRSKMLPGRLQGRVPAIPHLTEGVWRFQQAGVDDKREDSSDHLAADYFARLAALEDDLTA